MSATSNNINNNNGPRYWPNTLYLTGLTASMAVNTLVTGMIVIRILRLKDTGVITSTLVGRTLGSPGGTIFRHIMFIIIESGMALFAIQLIRVVLEFIPVKQENFNVYISVEDIVISTNQMLNVIIYKIHFISTIFLFC